MIKVDTVLFFDMDGTLVDTNLANFLSYQKAIMSVTGSDYGITYDPEKRLNRSSLKGILRDLSEDECGIIIIEKEKCYNEFLHEIKLNEKIAGILSKYYKTNQTVLVTNCRKERALMVLNHFDLVGKFSNIFHRQFAENGKKINKFQYAISQMGVLPNLIVAFENEEIEIADARYAGIKIINPII